MTASMSDLAFRSAAQTQIVARYFEEGGAIALGGFAAPPG